MLIVSNPVVMNLRGCDIWCVDCRACIIPTCHGKRDIRIYRPIVVLSCRVVLWVEVGVRIELLWEAIDM
jgi:hypothetical protein